VKKDLFTYGYHNMSISPNRKKIFHLIDKSGLGLEIGPSYNPIAPKRDGWNVEIVDHLDAESLRKKYAVWGVNVSAIEEVDYVVGSSDMFSAIGEESRYDFIIASHVIEHMPDVVKFLVDCEKLLKTDGILSLIIPDKRFCFDILKPLTTTGQIIQAHIEERSRHTPGTIFDAHALHIKNGESIVWSGDRNPTELKFMHSIAEAKKIMDDYIELGQFKDVHAWQFVPASFEMIISDLIEIGLLKLNKAASFNTEGHEFFVSLRKNLVHTQIVNQNRMALAKLAAEDGAAVSSQPVIEEGAFLPDLGHSAIESKHLFEYNGFCPICEENRMFVSDNEWFRDHLLCTGCHSIPRERAVMRLITELKPDWRNLAIHESSPSSRGTSMKLMQHCGGYVSSQYDSSLSPGKLHPRKKYRNEDLGNQTFPDESFDIVVTQDVFEHLPDPAAAIKEIARTLKQGGVHIASVPLVRKWGSSRNRVRQLQGGEVEHILPPEYHGNPVDDNGSLVMNDWGYDIGAFFQRNSGMDTVIYHINDISNGIRAEYIEVVVSMKDRQP
jgi:2-polyprenyl-3-methyl-5-hydroxy-6-metoxy-1,4-benzoquinol methylase